MSRAVETHERCSNRSAHTHGPADYIAWHEWAERMSATHDQSLCDGCGRYVIWTPKVGPGSRDTKEPGT